MPAVSVPDTYKGILHPKKHTLTDLFHCLHFNLGNTGVSNNIIMAQGRNTRKVARSPGNGNTSPTQLLVGISIELSVKMQFIATSSAVAIFGS